jgi:hypothetical protein
MRKGWIFTLTVVAVAGLLIAAIALRPHGSSVVSRAQDSERTEDVEREDPAREAEEHVGAAVTAAAQSRITRAEARAMAPLAPPAGWAGEIKLGVEDTWEPTIAADPNTPYLYVMYNRFGGPKACNRCPGTPMYVRVSANNGASWGAETYLCQCSGVKFQYDPVVKVASNGVAYATFMNGYDMMFSKSSDHGATWSAPIEVSAKPWADKPWIGVSPSGTDVYIAYETASDVWVAASHNAGASFATAVKLNADTGRYRYPNGLEVLPNGTALLSASSYPGSQQQTGPIDIEIWRTTNGGTSWARTILATPFTGVTWETSSTTALASDTAGNLVALYTGATTLGGNGHVWTRRSTDSGVTWAAAVEIGNGTANASFPAIAGGASGVFRLHYADNRTGSWNAYYRSSTDGGATWSAESDISDADTGATYKTAAGFSSPYGDYGAIDVTNTGKTVAVWGEGASFSAGPGGIWFNHMT